MTLGGGVQGVAYGLHRYAGPKPPKGRTHTYRFTVCALDCALDLSSASRKKAVLRARELVKRGADTLAFASCIKKGTPIGYPCPFAKKMKELIQKDLGEQVSILDYTH